MRIIQDSEDEDDLELEAAHVAAPAGDEPPNHISSNASPMLGEKGTGSTESLKRAIVAAHREQFRDESSDRQGQSNPSGPVSAANPSATSNFQDALQSSISLPGHASKTSLDGAVALSPARDILPTTYDERSPEQALHNNIHLGGIPERPWESQGTMQDNWEHHEPMGLFAQTVSSTIPNATATQEQLLAEVLAPDFLEVEPEPDPAAPKYEPAKSSVPWSEYLKSSSRAPEVPLLSAEQLPHLSPNNACYSTAQPNGNPFCSEPRAESPDPLHFPVVERMSNIEATAPEVDLQNSIRHTATSPSSNTKGKLSSVPESEDDLMTIGVPLEQYKARPSRSRSMKLSTEEPINYSQRPERVAKKTRRTRTYGEVETTSTATTPEKVRQICDMGFTPLTTKKALRQHNGDVTHTVDWLIANGVPAEDELPPPKSSKTKDKKKSKRHESTQDLATDLHQGTATGLPPDSPIAAVDASAAANVEDVLEFAPTTSIVKSPTTVKVVIPRTKKIPTPSKHIEQLAAPFAPQPVPEDVYAETAKQQEVHDGPDIQLDEPAVAAKQPQKGKKRGRGRPRKETKTIESIEQEPPEKRSKPDDTVDTENARLEDRANMPDESIIDGHRVSDADNANLNSKVGHTTPEPPPIEKKVKQTTEAPPSIGKGKTPYRVGLSKRARIAPLLRIVKK
ncbi:uncharacterized protein N0V89_005003 [Didymosphaeria variabile]|uniref:UBA domain-containing protein n=1 Tax=Didymosphaeria variabile TaxID=1932322 RepID=A0A9W8XKI6_9PLEO|nr:uncharacterized protein N0V89_005003 [Didymosphaeria variabile]KAJ4353276.1 hypothetical protein N0V89_005003 [Didymosphaeria variabile]